MDFRNFPCYDFHSENLALQLRMTTVANSLFNLALREKVLEVPERQAFALALRHEIMPTPFFVSKIGYAFPDNAFRVNCFGYAAEKIDRALRNGHLSSHITRDEKTQWGGGIWIDVHGCKWGTGVSGLKEWEDEGLGIVIDMYTFNIPVYTAEFEEILNISGNTSFTNELLGLAEAEFGRPGSLPQKEFAAHDDGR